jgi:hypothetical protein
MKKFLGGLSVLSLGFVPGLVLAVDDIPETAGSIGGIIGTIGGFINMLMPILITAAAVWFVWNVISYTIAGDDKKKESAKNGIITGLIGLLVIVAFWGIIALVMNTFGVGTGENLDIIPRTSNVDIKP